MLAAAAAGCVVVAALASPPVMAQQVSAPDPYDDVVGLVITRESGTSAAEAQDLVAAELGTVGDRTAVAPGVTAVSVPDLQRPEAIAAARALRADEGVADVGLDTRVQPDSDDPRFAEQWSLTDPVSGLSAVPAWALTKAAGQVIAVIDSGITPHEDLNANVLPGYDMVQDALVANDGDGRDPDPTDRGDWLTASEIQSNPEVFAGCAPQTPSSWHGTHVAGLVAAVQGNAKGISGVAPAARIQAVRALGKCGGRMSDIAAAITWASGGEVPGSPVNPTPADVINLSVSSTATCQPFVQAAIDDALGRGASVVVSAGNNAQPFNQYSPAGCYDVITVGAVNRAGNRASYSNYGVAGRDLPLFAPGGAGVKPLNPSADVLSTMNAGTTTPSAATDTYAVLAGTSMAAPQVAGAAALLRAYTGMGPAAVAEHLRDTARPFAPASNCTGSCGAGILDINAALRTAPVLPTAPQNLVAKAADGSVVASWDAPADEGSGAVTGYDIEYRQNGGQWLAVDDLWSSTLREKVFLELTNGVSYEVRVAARSVFGAGPWAESNVAVPLPLPGSVQIRSVRYPSASSARVQLTLPAESLSGLQFRVTRVGRSPGLWQDAAVGSTLRLPGLKPGVRHSLQVRALNTLGAGATADRWIATPVKPSTVRQLSLRRKGRTAAVSWKEPRRTGMRLRYRLRIGDGGAWQKTSKTSVRLRGVAPGPLRVTVQPWNEAGRGPVVTIVKRK